MLNSPSPTVDPGRGLAPGADAMAKRSYKAGPLRRPPTHPGEVAGGILEDHRISGRQAAAALGLSPNGLHKVLNGTVPTQSDLALLHQVFGREVANRIVASIPTIQKAKNLGLELWNVPRSLMSSFDLSAPFRQGLVSGAGHPRIFAKNFGPMLKAFGSENRSQGDTCPSLP